MNAFQTVLRRVGLCSVVAILPFVTVTSLEAQTVGGDWHSLVSAVVREDPQLRSARQRYVSRKHETVGSYLGFIPDLIVRGYGGNADIIKWTDFDPGKQDFDTIESKTFFNRYGYAADARLSLLDFGINIARVQRASGLQNIALHNHNLTLSAVIKRAILTYTELYYSTQRRQYLINRVRILDEKLKGVARAVRQNQRSAIDQWNAELASQVARESLLEAEEAQSQAASRFERVFQRKIDPRTLTEVVLPVELIPVSQDEARLLVSSRNPAFLLANNRSLISEHDRNISLREVMPDVALVGSFSDQRNEILSPVGSQQQYTFELQAVYNIGRMPQALTNYLAFSASADAEASLANEERRNILERFDHTWYAFQGSKRRVALLRQAIASNQKILDAQRKLGQSGASDIVSVLDIETSFSRMLERQLNAYLEYTKNVVDLMESTNLLTVRGLKLSLGTSELPSAQ